MKQPLWFRFAAMAAWKFAVVVVVVAGCSERNKNVCCTTAAECAQLNLPPSEVGNRGCEDGMSCVDLTCVPTPAIDASTGDAPPDAPYVGRCDSSKPFGDPTIVQNVNTGLPEKAFALTSDELTAYIVRDNSVNFDLTSTTRSSIDDDFPVDQVDPDLASFPHGVDPWSARQSHLLFYRGLGGTAYESSRNTTTDVFPAGTKLMVDSANLSGNVTIVGSSPDALRFYWTLNSGQLQVATNQGSAYEFVNTTQISAMQIYDAAISVDELALYYNAVGADGIYVSTRADKTAMFEPGATIQSLGFTSGDTPFFVTADQCILYFERGGDIYVTRKPH